MAHWLRLTKCTVPRACPIQIRSIALECAYKIVAYIDERLLRCAKAPPFHLAIGDIRANLTTLQNGPPHPECVTDRIRDSLLLGTLPQLPNHMPGLFNHFF